MSPGKTHQDEFDSRSKIKFVEIRQIFDVKRIESKGFMRNHLKSLFN